MQNPGLGLETDWRLLHAVPQDHAYTKESEKVVSEAHARRHQKHTEGNCCVTTCSMPPKQDP